MLVKCCLCPALAFRLLNHCFSEYRKARMTQRTAKRLAPATSLFFPVLLLGASALSSAQSVTNNEPPAPAGASRPYVNSASAASATMTYLQQASDRFQHTVDVYTDADAAGNHFPARGEFDSIQSNSVPTMDEISSGAPCLGITCITATFDPSRSLWGGWYFMNGVLPIGLREPVPSWGDQPNVGYDLTGATVLQFWARGAVGGEVVHFLLFGVGNTAIPFEPFPDSSAKVDLRVVLSTTWTQYQIPLTGLDLHYILGGFGWMANTIEAHHLQPLITFYIDNIQYLKERPDDPRLLVSYDTIKSTDLFDTVFRNAAYVYDNAVALIAFIASGDLAHARTIADALVYAQKHDRFFTDGRVRNTYQGGDISLPPGWTPNNLANTVRMAGRYDPSHATWLEDNTQVSTNTGNVAWAGLGLLHMWEVTKDPNYLTAAEALGDWALSDAIEKRDGAPGVLGGFTGGYDGWENGAVSANAANCASGVSVNGQCKRLYKSTEHNIDLYSMFSRLYLADRAPKWANAAQRAKHFFLSMWDPREGKFWTGTTEDGVTVSTDVIPLDIQAWAIQTLGTEAQAYLPGLAYIEAHHKTSLGYGFKQNGGNACGDNTWFEGTSQVALAYLLSGNTSKWQSIIDGVHSVRTANGGIPATDGACLNTGFTLNDGSPWRYFPRIHVGATGWLALAENGVNPYRAELYSPALSSSAVAFGDQRIAVQGSARTVTFSNPGVGPLSIRGVALTGPNASEFTQSNNCGASLASGATCTITLVFTPAAAGIRNAALTITESSDTAMAPAQFSLNLTGIGVTPFVLTLNAVPPLGGTITATPAPTSGTYAAGARVCLTATPALGWSFAGWSGDSLDADGCLIMTANKSVTANFTLAQQPNGTPSQLRIYRNGLWYVDGNRNRAWDGVPPDQLLSFGVAGDIPILGDWDGSGRRKLGVYRGGSWYVDYNGNDRWDGTGTGGDKIFSFGVPGDIPVIGDWDGTGRLRIGVYRNGLWYVDLNGNNQWDGTGSGGDAIFSFGVPGDIPIVGDWDGSGRLRIGVYRNGLWYVDLNGNNQWDGAGPSGDAILSFGVPGDVPVIGDWDGSGKLRIGIYRGGLWYVDLNGNNQWDGQGADAIYLFGVPTDSPIVFR
jgi:hypothetical protein